MSPRCPRWLLVLSSLIVAAGAGCGSGAAPVPPVVPAAGPERPSPGPDELAPDGSALPAPRIDRECLDPYAGCPAAVGLPALSADGARVAVPDRGPDSERDQRALTIRILAVAGGAELGHYDIIQVVDYELLDPASGELTDALRARVDPRIEAVRRVLDEGGFRPLTALGTVHEQRAGAEVDGLRASFDGEALEVFDARLGQVRWHRALGPSAAEVEDGRDCGPFAVAEVQVWVSREAGVIVAQVVYLSDEMCAPEQPFLVWR
ncbi:hypothetical protein [Haliangium sp.]|uniref:hypothetical protein n=1 Tax=Haliangium sp. TaxID=2663208 RepID=UPI003D0DC8F2